MPLTAQPFNVHPDKVYDIAAAAVATDGSPLVLTNLDFSPNTSDAGTDVGDSNEADHNDGLDTTGAVVGSHADLTFTADGDDGKKYEALGAVTVVAPDVEIGEMQLTFTVRP